MDLLCKNEISGLAFLFFFFVNINCSTKLEPQYILVTGETMGTYYRITALTQLKLKDLKHDIDSLLINLNGNLSTYIPSSHISRLNSSEAGIVEELPDQFWINLSSCIQWYKYSQGYFDPSVMPLVNYWGFGYEPKRAVLHVDSLKVDSIMTFVGLDQWDIDIDRKEITKIDYRQQLDFSALAKGYGVDIIAEYLEEDGIYNYLVDIGGEMRAFGKNSSGIAWVVGINEPLPGADLQDVSSLIQLDHIALATSGNYRNYHVVNGSKYGHTINPKTGYPFQDRLLSVSVATEKCMDADAIATTCMAMGLDKACTFIENLDGVDACFLAGKDDGTIETIYSNGFIRHKYQP
ncbi:MAG: thiamine biosynthesis lipoprotein [Saprospiraceae bacterium]|jgi:thiamine biosynthesis lipoprotein